MKKIVVVMIMLLQLTSVAVFAETNDELSTWAVEYVENISKQDILEKEFISNFSTELTRGEAAYLGVKLYENYTGKVATVGDASFVDTTDEWALKAKNLNIIGGYSEGTFLPDRTITREELAVIFVNVLNASEIEYIPYYDGMFDDDYEISSWAKEAVYIAKANGVINGVGKNKFDAHGQATKEEALVIFNKAQTSKEIVNYEVTPISDDAIENAGKIVESLTKTFKDGSFHLNADVTTEMNANSLEKLIADNSIPGMTKELNEKALEIINGLSLSLDYKLVTDIEKYTLDYELDYNLNYKSSPLLTVGVILNNDEMGIGLNNFYDKYLVFDFKTIFAKLKTPSETAQETKLDVNKYLEIIMKSELSKRENNEQYNKIVLEYLATSFDGSYDEKITFDVDGKATTEAVKTYKMKYSQAKYYRMMKRLVMEANSDEQMKKNAQTLLTDIVKEVIASKDYVHFNLTEEEMKKSLAKLTNEFDEVWDEVIVAMLEGNRSPYGTSGVTYKQSTQMVKEFYENMETQISINEKDILRRINLNIVGESVSVNIKYVIQAIGSDVVIQSKEDKYINASDYIDYSNNGAIKNEVKLAGIIREGLESAIKELGQGKGYVMLIEDLKPFEEISGVAFSKFDSYLQMMSATLDLMTDEDLVEQFGTGLLK